ncbi:MAG: hypothetical protein JWP69_2226 [Flaviaesturariibacter sp.]|nr:hypothetical protein [Flaviaesturariibacter sp.]
MQCVICKTGETAKSTSSFTVERNGSYLIFTGVEADVCANCGEAYFSEETTKALLEKANSTSSGTEVEIIRLAS